MTNPSPYPAPAEPAPPPPPGPESWMPRPMAGYGEWPGSSYRPRRRGRRGLAVGLAAAAVLVGGGGATLGVNAYAKNNVCTALAADTSDTGRNTGPTAAEVHRRTAELRSSARLLLVDRSLHDAVEGLADDLDQFVAMAARATATGKSDAKAVTQYVTLVASINTHATSAQRACGQPATGIFGS